MSYKLKLLRTEKVTHNVKRFILEKPKNYRFIPGQATLVSIDEKGWRSKKRPFTFTSLNSDDKLEFIIKRYDKGKGVTKKLHQLKSGRKLLIREPFGTINYIGEGVFIAGGTGITPFIAILRELKKEVRLNRNKLIFSNKSSKDIILEKEFKEMFKGNPENLILTLTHEDKEGYENREIDKKFLDEKISDFNQKFYVCGTPNFVYDIRKILKDLRIKSENIIFEGAY